jgi:hypothetical protein
MQREPEAAAQPQQASAAEEAMQVDAPPAAAPQTAHAGAAQAPLLPAPLPLGPEDEAVQAALLSVGCLASQLDGGGDSDGEGAVSQGCVAQRQLPSSCPVGDATLAHMSAEQLLQAQVVGCMGGEELAPAGVAAATVPLSQPTEAGAVEATPAQARQQAPAEALEQEGRGRETDGHPQRRRHSSSGGFKSSRGRLAAMHGSAKASGWLLTRPNLLPYVVVC